MLKKILSPFTTATAGGVVTRYATIILSTALTILGLLNWLSPEQIEALRGSIPDFVEALSALVGVAVVIYGVITKSSSDKAAEAAKQIDAKLPPDAPVKIETPGPQPNIVVPAKP